MQTNQPSSPKESPSIGRLAQRISRWTTNSLLTVMLLVIALGFGREVLHWWHDETPPRRPSAAGTLSGGSNGEEASEVLSFGNQAWSIRRQEFAGSRAEVPAALVRFCRTAIGDAAPHGGAPDAAEMDVLRRLAAEKPIAEEAGLWRLYQWGEGFPIVCGTRMVGWRAPDAGPVKGTILAEPPYRVVIWGIGVPAAASAWSLYVFRAEDAGSAREPGAGRVPLAPGCRRLASVCEAGNSITAFSASDAAGDSARPFYDRWFAEHGWIATARWQRIGNGWHARFESAAGTPRLAVDIRLGSDSQGQCTGLVMERQEK